MKSSKNVRMLAVVGASMVTGTTGLHAANIALGAEYAYTTMPEAWDFNATYINFYTDNVRGHAGYTTPNAFDTGDLTDGVIQTTGTPGSNTATDASIGFGSTPGGSWIPPYSSTIVFDLAGSFSISNISVGTYVYTDFANGAPVSVGVSFSSDNVTYSSVTNYNFAAATTNGHYYLDAAATSASANYVKLDFNGASFQSGNKFTIDEIQIEGVAVPVPSSTALLGLAACGLMLRRR